MNSKRLYKFTILRSMPAYSDKPRPVTFFTEITEEMMQAEVAKYKADSATLSVTVHEYIVSGVSLVTDMEKRWCGV